MGLGNDIKTWFTGRNGVYKDDDKVEAAKDDLNSIKEKTPDLLDDPIHKAIRKLNNVNGFEQYVGHLEKTSFDELTSGVETAIDVLVNKINDNQNQMNKYSEGNAFEHIIATTSVLAGKFGEGFLSVFEGIGDVAITGGAWITNIPKLWTGKDTGVSKKLQKAAAFDVSAWAMSPLTGANPNSWVAKYSAITKDSGAAAICKGVGIATGYVTGAGYISGLANASKAAKVAKGLDAASGISKTEKVSKLSKLANSEKLAKVSAKLKKGVPRPKISKSGSLDPKEIDAIIGKVYGSSEKITGATSKFSKILSKPKEELKLMKSAGLSSTTNTTGLLTTVSGTGHSIQRNLQDGKSLGAATAKGVFVGAVEGATTYGVGKAIEKVAAKKIEKDAIATIKKAEKSSNEEIVSNITDKVSPIVWNNKLNEQELGKIADATYEVASKQKAIKNTIIENTKIAQALDKTEEVRSVGAYFTKPSKAAYAAGQKGIVGNIKSVPSTILKDGKTIATNVFKPVNAIKTLKNDGLKVIKNSKIGNPKEAIKGIATSVAKKFDKMTDIDHAATSILGAGTVLSGTIGSMIDEKAENLFEKDKAKEKGKELKQEIKNLAPDKNNWNNGEITEEPETEEVVDDTGEEVYDDYSYYDSSSDGSSYSSSSSSTSGNTPSEPASQETTTPKEPESTTQASTTTKETEQTPTEPKVEFSDEKDQDDLPSEEALPIKDVEFVDSKNETSTSTAEAGVDTTEELPVTANENSTTDSYTDGSSTSSSDYTESTQNTTSETTTPAVNASQTQDEVDPADLEGSIVNETEKESTVTKISKPTEKENSSGGGSAGAVIPVLAGVSAAAAAGIGAKTYLDRKSNNNNDSELDESNNDDYIEDNNADYQVDYNDGIEKNEYLDSEEETDEEFDNYYEEQPKEEYQEKYDAKTNEELADME